MGWLFSDRWPNKAALVDHLTTGNGVKTLKHCCVGNNLWCVHETHYGNNVIRFICLYMMKGPTKDKGYTGRDKDWWGYKDVDESAGPTAINCPTSYLDSCTAPEGPYAYEWRQAVYARSKRLREMVGKQIVYRGVVFDVVKRRQGGGFSIRSPAGHMFNIGPNDMARAQELSRVVPGGV